MLTRCPSCATIFRVSVEQLKAKQGVVRCGKCRQVFNALDAIVEMEPAVASESTVAESSADGIRIEEFPVEEFPAEESRLEEVRVEEIRAEESPAEAPPVIAPPAEEPVAPAADAAEDIEDTPVWGEADPEHLYYEDRPARRRTWLWVSGSVLLALLLLLQAAVQFRNDLVVLFPDTAPALRHACALFGCKLSLPHKPNLLGIEASDLHPDPSAKNRLLFSATLQNRAPFAQAYPDLQLTLTDTADRPLIRKIIRPATYLPRQSNIAAGFAANGEIAVKLTLEVADGIEATGYRLYLFYP